jgi:dipeptidyl aminopeptidase/acylaminoacyl peptidase
MLLMVAFLGVSAAHADPERVTGANYKQAFKYSNTYLRQFVYDSSVKPNWIGKTDSFWYQYRTSNGTNYYRVNPRQATKEPLFDRVKLATLLSETIQKPLDPATLPLARMTINDDGAKVKFVVEEFQYEYDLPAEKLTKLGKAPPPPRTVPGTRGRGQFQRRQELDEQQRRDQQQDEQQRRDQQQDEQQRENQQQDEQQRENQQQGQRRGGPQGSAGRAQDYRNFSPDRKTYVFARKHNLYFAEAGKEAEAVALTTDGAEDYSFGGGNDDRKARSSATWSRDSKAFYVTRSDTRGVKELFLVNSLAAPRPTLEKYKYPMPGEEAVRKSELYLFDRATKKLTRIKPKWKDERYSNTHWGKTSEELRFVRRDRLQRHMELCTVHVPTGETKCLLTEGFENANINFQPVRYLDESDEMIWWSERSGWGHFYLYDRSGKLKNAITSGLFRASRIAAVDPKNRLLYFHGNGREPGENVYLEHLYCVHLDGTGLTLMDPGNGNHQSVLSPSRQFVVDNCSRIDLAPVSILRDATGRPIMELERADLSRLTEAGWKMPETFVVKAADGVTDLYGNLWKPFDFDPKRKYPVIAHVYPGPQQEGVTHTFSAVSTNQQLAQLGFIVVQVGHRGGTPARSKAYHSYGYFNLRDYGLADKKAAIEQLAARHPFIDIDRVGIYGHSGGGFMSAAALLQKPYNEFFKAAVASAGNHDNNIYNDNWSERYHGLRQIVVKKDDSKTKDGRSAADASRRDVGTNGTQGQDGTDGGGGNGNGQEQAQGEQAGKKDEQGQDKKSEDGKEKKDQGEKKEEAPPETRFEIKVPTNAELAANLKGHLLLVHGEVDNNVHPANTLRLVDALIKANKRFDMLILPGKRHGFGDYQPYFQQRMWDFFAEHLLGDRQTGADILNKQEKKP